MIGGLEGVFGVLGRAFGENLIGDKGGLSRLLLDGTDHHHLFGAFKILGLGAVVHHGSAETLLIDQGKLQKVGVFFGIVHQGHRPVQGSDHVVTATRFGSSRLKINIGAAFAQGAHQNSEPRAQQQKEEDGASFHAPKFATKIPPSPKSLPIPSVSDGFHRSFGNAMVLNSFGWVLHDDEGSCPAGRGTALKPPSIDRAGGRFGYRGGIGRGECLGSFPEG